MKTVMNTLYKTNQKEKKTSKWYTFTGNIVRYNYILQLYIYVT